ncbi:MAG: hypothetical protein ABL963_13455 [Longimicrobiales bacterium]
MHPIAACAETALRHHVDPALRLRELVELVAVHVDLTLDAARLRGILESYPEHFRLLDPWRGRWEARTARDPEEPDPGIDVWVIGVSEGAPPPGTSPALRLRESVRWLARGVDPRSPSDVGRWYAIVLAERAVRHATRRAA